MPTSPKPYGPDSAFLERILVPSRSQPTLGTFYVSRTRRLDLETVLDRVTHALPELNAAIKEPDVLLSQLLALDPARRADAFDERPSLRRPLFLKHVRDSALAALPQQPDLAEVLASLAIQQAEVSPDVVEARRQLHAAYCLLATVRRLRRQPNAADSLLARAALLLDAEDDQDVFLRSVALLRWEQGRPGEAHALLARAVSGPRGWRAAGEPGRAPSGIALSQLLLVLLHLLEGVPVDRALLRLRLASASLDAAHQPFPALLAQLSLAYVLALAGKLEAASVERCGAQELFALLTDESAAAYAGWLDARVSVLISPEGGLERLLFARKELLVRELPLAATLATVDAVYYLSVSQQHELVPAFLTDAPPPLELPPATELCQDLGVLPKGTYTHKARYRTHLRRKVMRLPSLLRRVCLLRGLKVEPLPFA